MRDYFMTATNNIMSKKQLFVHAFLWGAKSRRQAMAYMWSNIIIAVMGLTIGFIFCALFLLFALADWGAIRWVDKNGVWTDGNAA